MKTFTATTPCLSACLNSSLSSSNTLLFIRRVSHLLSYRLPSNIDVCLIVHASRLSCYIVCVYMGIS